MLIVQALDDSPEHGVKRGDQFSFYIVDAHHHMGREKTHLNTPSGAYAFYAQLWLELKRMATEMLERDSLLYRPVEVRATPFVERLFSSRDVWSSLSHGWLVDRTVVFPYSDDYARAGAPESPSFMVSNDRIAGWTTRAPHSARLIGFARLDPNDAKRGPADLALRELDRAIMQLGLRGLKLHPLSQLFIDELADTPTKSILLRAAELGIPVIFDTQNINTVKRIAEVSRSVREDTSSRASHSGIDIILAHCGMSPANPSLYDVLAEPHIYGETSTMHDRDIPLLFKTAYERLGNDSLVWSSKFLFGTDYTFLSVQAAQLILYLLSRDFPGGPADIARILGGNAMSIIQRPMRTASGSMRAPSQIVFSDSDEHRRIEMEHLITHYIGSGNWELLSMDLMLPPSGTWHCPPYDVAQNACGISLSSYLLTVLCRRTNEEFHIWVRRQPGGYISCSVVGTRHSPSISSMELCTNNAHYDLERALNEHTNLLQDRDSISEAFAVLFAD